MVLGKARSSLDEEGGMGLLHGLETEPTTKPKVTREKYPLSSM
jgi:hypothetical protein